MKTEFFLHSESMIHIFYSNILGKFSDILSKFSKILSIFENCLVKNYWFTLVLLIIFIYCQKINKFFNSVYQSSPYCQFMDCAKFLRSKKSIFRAIAKAKVSCDWVRTSQVFGLSFLIHYPADCTFLVNAKILDYVV